MKRLFASALCCCVVFGLFGCGGKKQDPNKLVIWHWMTDRDEAFQELAAQYQEKTGIEVAFELYAPSDVYSQKVIAAAQARVLPDIFGILDKKSILASFIESGFIADLTPYFEQWGGQWRKSIFPKALAVNEFPEDNPFNIEPGIYGVPIDVTNIQMLYNKKLLAKAGINKPPKTFDEFLDTIGELRRVGVVGLVSGWGELWIANCFASNYAFNIMGEEKIMDTYRGDVPYTDPDWIKVFGVFDTLRQKGALIDGIVTKANKYAEQDFALERAAYAFNGSWTVNVYHDMNPDLEYGVMLPPAISNERPIQIWGGAGSSFMVNDTSSNKEKAVEFLKWLTDKEQQAFLAKKTLNLPANRHALSSIPEVLADFSKGMENTTHPTVWELNENPLVVEAFNRGLQSIIIGEKTPEQVAQGVQKVKEHQMERAAARQR